MKIETRLALGILLAAFGWSTIGCGPKPAPVAKNLPQSNPTAVPVVPGPPLLNDLRDTGPSSQPIAPVGSVSEATPSNNPAPAPSSAPTGSGLNADTVTLPPPDPPATPTETVKADVGVGQKGRSLDPYEGILVTPAKAFFSTREKVLFQIQIPDAYNKYKASEEVPLTFAEFKEKVLDPNQIKLIPLPPGHTYDWDPEKEELTVRRPAKR